MIAVRFVIVGQTTSAVWIGCERRLWRRRSISQRSISRTWSSFFLFLFPGQSVSCSNLREEERERERERNQFSRKKRGGKERRESVIQFWTINQPTGDATEGGRDAALSQGRMSVSSLSMRSRHRSKFNLLTGERRRRRRGDRESKGGKEA